MDGNTRHVRNNSYVIPELRAAVDILKFRLESVPRSSKTARFNSRFQKKINKSVGPGTYQVPSYHGSGYTFNNIPRLQNTMLHNISSNSYSAFEVFIKKNTGVYFKKRNKQQLENFSKHQQTIREKNRKHLKSIENKLKTRQNSRIIKNSLIF